MRAVARAFTLLAAVGCADGPDPCVPMCAAAAELYGGCLEGWGTDWTAAGYDDKADFLDACDTWAWTSRELEAEADKEGAVDAECRSRQDTLEGGTCDDFTALDWSGVPW